MVALKDAKTIQGVRLGWNINKYTVESWCKYG